MLNDSYVWKDEGYQNWALFIDGYVLRLALHADGVFHWRLPWTSDWYTTGCADIEDARRVALCAYLLTKEK